MATLTAGADGTATGYNDGTLGGSAFGTFTGTLGGATVNLLSTDSTVPDVIVVYTAAGSFAAVNGKSLEIDGTIYAQASCVDISFAIYSTYTATGFSFVNTTVYAVDFAVYAGPTHVGTTLGLGGAGSIAVAFGSTGRAAGDRMFIAVMTANEAVPAVSGWTVVTPDSGTASRGTAGAAGGVRCTVLTKVSDGTETSVTIGDSGNIQYAAGIVVRGDSGADVDLGVSIGGNAAASTSGSFTGVTTDGDNQFILTFVATDRDAAAASWSSQANANLGNLTERFDNGTATNTGGGVAIYTGEKLVAGATGTTTATQAAGAAYCWITLAVKNAAGAGGSDGALTSAATGSGSITGQRTASSPISASATGSASSTGRATAQATVIAAGTGTTSAVGRGIVTAALSALASGAGSIDGASVVVSAGVVSGAGQGSGAISGASASAATLASTALGSGSIDGRSTRAGACEGASVASASIAALSSAASAVSAAGAGTGSVSGNAIRPAILAAAATGSGAVTGRSTAGSDLSATGTGAALISSASNTTVVGALASSGSSSASIVGRQVVAASLSASAAGQGAYVGTGVRGTTFAALGSASGLAIGAASVSAEMAGTGAGSGLLAGALVNAAAVSGIGTGAGAIEGQRLVMATLNGVAVSLGAIVGLSRITLPASEARNVATALASRTANSNEPARAAATARSSRDQVTAVGSRDSRSVRLAR